MRSRGVFLAPILLAAALRFPALASRPMHADEAVHADKFGTLLESGRYAYDPAEYHGPTLYYLTLLPAWLQGASRYVEIDEVTLRSVPAALGVALVAAHIAAAACLGTPAAADRGAAFGALARPWSSTAGTTSTRRRSSSSASARSSRRAATCTGPAPVPALLAGACVGLTHATKETAPLALGSMLLALALTLAVDRWRGQAVPTVRSLVRGRDVTLALGTAVLVSCLLFSSFLGHPQGVVDSLRAYGIYAERAGAASWHFHPWDYYLRLLIYFPAERNAGVERGPDRPAGGRRGCCGLARQRTWPERRRGSCASSGSTRS